MSKIQNFYADYHRNGVGGRPFYVCTFTYIEDDGESEEMMAVMFPSAEGSSPYFLPLFDSSEQGEEVAVFNRTRLAEGTIAFGRNSYRGDRFVEPLRTLLHAALIERERYNDAVDVANATWGYGSASRMYGPITTTQVWESDR